MPFSYGHPFIFPSLYSTYREFFSGNICVYQKYLAILLLKSSYGQGLWNNNLNLQFNYHCYLLFIYLRFPK